MAGEAATGTDAAASKTVQKPREADEVKPRGAGSSQERPPSPDVRSLRWKDTTRTKSQAQEAGKDVLSSPASGSALAGAVGPGGQEQELKRVRRELADAQLMLMGKEAEFRNELKQLQERNAELLDKIVRLTQRDRELQARIVDAQFDGSGAKAEVKKLDEELRDLRRAYQRKEKELEALTAHVEELQRSGNEAEERLGECGEGLEKEREALDAVHKRIQENLAAVTDLTTERDRLRNRLLGAEGDMATLKEQLRSALTRRASVPAPRSGPEGRSSALVSETEPSAPMEARSVATEATDAPAALPSGVPSAEAEGRYVAAQGPLVDWPRPFFVSGRGDAPLVAMAAGQRPEVALAAQARRAHRAELARATLESMQALGGIPRLPQSVAVFDSTGVEGHGADPGSSGDRDSRRDRGPSGRGRRDRSGRGGRKRGNRPLVDEAGGPEQGSPAGGGRHRPPRGRARDRGDRH